MTITRSSLKVTNFGRPLDNQTWQTKWKTTPLAKVQLCEVQKPNFEHFWCGQPFVYQVWLSNLSHQNFFTFTYTAHEILWNWLINKGGKSWDSDKWQLNKQRVLKSSQEFPAILNYSQLFQDNLSYSQGLELEFLGIPSLLCKHNLYRWEKLGILRNSPKAGNHFCKGGTLWELDVQMYWVSTLYWSRSSHTASNSVTSYLYKLLSFPQN